MFCTRDEDIDGKDSLFSSNGGRVVSVVNSDSFCFTIWSEVLKKRFIYISKALSFKTCPTFFICLKFLAHFDFKQKREFLQKQNCYQVLRTQKEMLFPNCKNFLNTLKDLFLHQASEMA